MWLVSTVVALTLFIIAHIFVLWLPVSLQKIPLFPGKKKKKHLHEYLDTAPASILFSSSVAALTSEDFSHEMLEAARDSSAIRE